MAKLKQIIWGDYETVGMSWEYMSEILDYKNEEGNHLYGYFVFVFEERPEETNLRTRAYNVYINGDPEKTIEIYVEGEVTEQNNPNGYELVGYYQKEDYLLTEEITSLTFERSDSYENYNEERYRWINLDGEDSITFYDIPPPPPPSLDLTYTQPYALDWNVRQLTNAVKIKHSKLKIKINNNADYMEKYGLGVGNNSARHAKSDQKSGLFSTTSNNWGSVLVLPSISTMTSLFIYKGNDAIIMKSDRNETAYINGSRVPTDTYYAGVRGVDLTQEEIKSGNFIYTKNQLNTEVITNSIKAGPAGFSRGSRKIEGLQFGTGLTTFNVAIGVPADKVIKIIAKAVCSNGEIYWQDHITTARRFTATLQTDGTVELRKTGSTTVLNNAIVTLYIEEEI